MKISINIAMPQERKPHPDTSLILEKIKDYILDCESSGHDDTTYQWGYLKALFLKLQGKKHSPLEHEIYELIKPCILKYVEYDSSLAPLLDGADLVKQYRTGR